MLKIYNDLNIIYGLSCPITNEIRYIGYASNLNRRINQHLQPSNLIKSNYKNNWIKSLLKINLKPLVVVLKKCKNYKELPKIEKEIIAIYKFLGYNLTNLTNGGDGTTGRILSSETKRKISASNIGKIRSTQTVNKWRHTFTKNKNVSPNKGRKFSEKHRKNLSIAHIGKCGKKSYLSNLQCKSIVLEYNTTNITKKELAKKYGVSKYTIYRAFDRGCNEK